MMHTGDKYETRARAERYNELHRIAAGLVRLLTAGFGMSPRRTRKTPQRRPANDGHVAEKRAA